ncbi:MAG TPA: hypothetical protein VHN14_14075 [Kofleriaceae bacterium]|jgi:hypothetical protein|nr:hypothetical protein [Kofleriaceae bacterium]
MRLWIAILATLSACGFNSPGHGDGGTGAEQLEPVCLGTFAKVCLEHPPTMPLMVAGAPLEIDTASSSLCDQQNDQKQNVCVVAAAGLTIPSGQSIHAYGTKPLVLVSTTTLLVAGTVDVSSSRALPSLGRGAGANPPDCVTMTPADGMGGGAGGSFGGKGGNGEMVGGTTGGVASPALTSPPPMLRGGCAGSDGASAGGLGGNGGGAVALIADTAIQIDGTVNASGAGGHGSPATRSGGGGGGSGGMIVFEAPTITGTGTVFANGGGGAQGGTGGSTPAIGADGHESTGPAMAGAGGTSSTEGGNGGTGSASPKINGLNTAGGAQGQGGGGAGGGGAGFVRAHGFPATVTVFPTVIDLP